MSGWSHWRWRIAISLARHACEVLPAARSSWAEAMHREILFIEDEDAALYWAFGCVLASYRMRFLDLPIFRSQSKWRQVGAACIVILLIGIAAEGRAIGQTAPPEPGSETMNCDPPGMQSSTVECPR